MSYDGGDSSIQSIPASEVIHATTESKKRRRNGRYIDRNQVIATGRKPPQIIPHIQAVEDKKTNRKYQFACKCNYKLTSMIPSPEMLSANNSLLSVGDGNVVIDHNQLWSTNVSISEGHLQKAILDVLVLDNNICILVLKDPVLDRISSIQFSNSLGTDNVSGRMKKGAMQVQAGSILCTVGVDYHVKDADIKLLDNNSNSRSISIGDGRIVEDGLRSLQLITPIGGKLLELNTNLLEPTNYQLLTNIKSYNHEGYIGVLYPDTELPSLTGYRDSDSLLNSYRHPSRVPGVCYEFLSGKCKRGSMCRFKHVSSEACEQV